MTLALHSPRSTPGFGRRRGVALFVAALCATVLFHSQLRAQEAAPVDRYDQQQDPPERVARLSFMQGNVSLQPSGVDQFGQAEANYPLSNGDRIYVDNQSHAELQSGGLAIRMGNGADLTLTGLSDEFAQLGLAQGSIHVRTYDLPNGSSVEIDTPNGTVMIHRSGDVRIDSFPQDDTTVVTVLSGQADATGPNLDQPLTVNQSLKLTGSNPIYTQYLGLLPPDDLDNFEQLRDRLYERNYAVQNQYVSPEMIGSADLEEAGDWQPTPEYGAVWYPRVAAGWRPYNNGHWAWVAPWGWTWIESEPWGFAPFHYGRWASFNGRWGWIPGPTIVRPVYSPALVVFVGGPSLSVSVGSLTAWFPLGPRETYVPWYHASPGYVNRVNVTNIYNRNVTEVRNIYNNRTTNIYINKTTVINNVTYVNRTVATTVIPQRSFAAGRPVAESANLRLEAQAQHQLASAPVLPHPLITPSKQIVAAAPARAVPANQARPVLETRKGLEQAVPGAAARPVPVRVLTPAQQTAMPATVTRGSTPVQPARQPLGPLSQGAPKQAQVVEQPQRPNVQMQRPDTQQQFQRPNVPQQVQTPNVPQQVQRPNVPQVQTPNVPQVQTSNVPQQVQRPNVPQVQTPNVPQQVQREAQPQPQHEPAPQQIRPSPAEVRVQPSRPEESVQPPAPRPAEQRTLINKAAPPPPQPSFEEQRRAIQKTDPGRPLGPVQVENLRNNRPAGPAQQPEPISHPAPRPAANPQPKPQERPSDHNR